MTEEAAVAIASVEYRDDGFSRRRLYTAWENLKDVMAYMLVGFDKRETSERHRFSRMVERDSAPTPWSSTTSAET
jgi:hypothetical protein